MLAVIEIMEHDVITDTNSIIKQSIRVLNNASGLVIIVTNNMYPLMYYHNVLLYTFVHCLLINLLLDEFCSNSTFRIITEEQLNS